MVTAGALLVRKHQPLGTLIGCCGCPVGECSPWEQQQLLRWRFSRVLQAHDTNTTLHALVSTCTCLERVIIVRVVGTQHGRMEWWRAARRSELGGECVPAAAAPIRAGSRGGEGRVGGLQHLDRTSLHPVAGEGTGVGEQQPVLGVILGGGVTPVQLGCGGMHAVQIMWRMHPLGWEWLPCRCSSWKYSLVHADLWQLGDGWHLSVWLAPGRVLVGEAGGGVPTAWQEGCSGAGSGTQQCMWCGYSPACATNWMPLPTRKQIR